MARSLIIDSCDRQPAQLLNKSIMLKEANVEENAGAHREEEQEKESERKQKQSLAKNTVFFAPHTASNTAYR